MLIGVVLACFYHPDVLRWGMLGRIAWAFAATCLVASSNYVINEILDAPRTASPRKADTGRSRPAASGCRWPIVEWVAARLRRPGDGGRRQSAVLRDRGCSCSSWA